MRRKDLFLVTGLCFLSAVFGVVIGKGLLDSGVQKLAFAKSRKSAKLEPRNSGISTAFQQAQALHKKTEVGKEGLEAGKGKGAKTWKEPPYDYIDGHLVSSGYTDGQVLKYNSAGSGTWEPGDDTLAVVYAYTECNIPAGATNELCKATCPAGYKLTGGGYHAMEITYRDYIIVATFGTANIWSVYLDNYGAQAMTKFTTFAKCAKIE